MLERFGRAIRCQRRGLGNGVLLIYEFTNSLASEHESPCAMGNATGYPERLPAVTPREQRYATNKTQLRCFNNLYSRQDQIP